VWWEEKNNLKGRVGEKEGAMRGRRVTASFEGF